MGGMLLDRFLDFHQKDAEERQLVGLPDLVAELECNRVALPAILVEPDIGIAVCSLNPEGWKTHATF